MPAADTASPLLLAVDVGNTHTVLGLFDGPRLLHDFRIGTTRERTVDELHVLLVSLLEVAGVPRARVRHSILASVVPAMNALVVEAVDRAFDHEMLVVGPGIKTGMRVLYENPKEVGADRIVNAVAAFERVKGACVVVDFGTATTFDCISAAGEYLGGAITPGIQISAQALFTRTAKLPKVDLQKPARVVGRTTTESMQSGLFFGYVALVDGLVRRIHAELGAPCPVLATGGLAGLIGPECETVGEIVDELTLEGLRLLHARNVERA